MRRSHALSHLIWAALVMSLIAIPIASAVAQEAPPPPPYLVTRAEGVVIGIAYDEAGAKSVAPAGVQMAPGATGTLIMYTAKDGYGLPHRIPALGSGSMWKAWTRRVAPKPGGW